MPDSLTDSSSDTPAGGSTDNHAHATDDKSAWYAGITRYQWLVLIIASAGWVFDVYEGQIFNITSSDMLRELLDNDSAAVKGWRDRFLAIFLFGGTVGGLLFGSLADRYGRRPILIVTILLYSLFSGLTYFATDIYQVGILRFLVALGIGGEWAVAASMVAEVFPAKARAQAASIFHASSILGTWLAAASGILVDTNWRFAYLLGVLPALLIVWVRASVREPERWRRKSDDEHAKLRGSFRDLLLNPRWAGRAIRGLLLAAVGLGTFWSVTVAGQALVENLLRRNGVADAEIGRMAKFAYGIVQAAGGGLGLLAFGPIAARFGRRPAFVGFQILAIGIVPITCFVPETYNQMLMILPVFGFLTLGIHAGYAIYFPELFPTHLRATGASFCFNGGRMMAVPVLLFSGWLKEQPGVDLRYAIVGLSSLFVLGIVIILTLPETRNTELPE
ncbi:MAG: MFS transporter [Pirellulaceae bacterium]